MYVRVAPSSAKLYVQPTPSLSVIRNESSLIDKQIRSAHTDPDTSKPKIK